MERSPLTAGHSEFCNDHTILHGSSSNKSHEMTSSNSTLEFPSIQASRPSPKPLPSIPSHEEPRHRRLAVEAGSHLRNFIEHTFVEEVGIEKGNWARDLEGALNELADAISRGSWLGGIKHARAIRKQTREEQLGAERLRREAMQEANNETSESRLRSKSRISPVSGKTKEESFHSLVEEQSNQVTGSTLSMKQALQQLLELVPKSPTTFDSTRKHLLLVVDSYKDQKGHVRVPSDYKNDPMTPSCVFSPGIYTLHSPDGVEEEAASNLILFGLKEWRGTSTHLSQTIGIRRCALRDCHRLPLISRHSLLQRSRLFAPLL